MAGQKILIVDDSITIRMQVREMLSKGSFEVSEAKDGLEGLDRIRQERPNLVLLDFFMPRMNGWEVLQHIQAQADLQIIPIVVMTGRKSEAEARVPELFKYFEFIEKPFEPKTLLGAVKSAMAKARSRQSVAVSLPAEAVPKAAEAPSITDTLPASSGDSVVTPQEIAILKTQVEKLLQQNAELKAALGDFKDQAGQSALAEIANLKSDLEALYQRNNDLRTEVERVSAEKAEGNGAGLLPEELGVLKSGIEALNHADGNMRAELESLKQQFTASQAWAGQGGAGGAEVDPDELAQLKAALQSANQRNNRIQEEVDGLTRQNAKIQAELDTLKKQMGQVLIVIQKKLS